MESERMLITLEFPFRFTGIAGRPFFMHGGNIRIFSGGKFDRMSALLPRLGFVILGLAMAASALGQAPANSFAGGDASILPASAPSISSDAPAIQVPVTMSPAVQLLESFQPSDIKFDLEDLIEVLRDRRHEGWVLAAYPDPKTGRPLIGAGFSLDLPAREHPQHDLLNPYPFLEPSSAELWTAAGLDPQQLQQILADYQARLDTWSTKKYRSQIKTLPPQISNEDATLLVRVAAIQAINNAKAYCRNFDQLSGSQQMALSQLVYQMGVNLEEFSQFLGLINVDSLPTPAVHNVSAEDAAYWKSVQQSLEQSQWARLYRTRAISVIAMLDPRYNENPTMAERRVGTTLRPAVVHRRGGRASAQLASSGKSSGTHRATRTRHTRKRKT
jgi:hypothetical protein